MLYSFVYFISILPIAFDYVTIAYNANHVHLYPVTFSIYLWNMNYVKEMFLYKRKSDK